MKELKRDLLRTKYTRVLVEEDFKYNAPHNFEVRSVEDDKLVCAIHFQEGPVLECGSNGVGNEDLINMVIERLEHFQRSEYACRENAIAITSSRKLCSGCVSAQWPENSAASRVLILFEEEEWA